MFNRFTVAAAVLLCATYGVSSASVAVDLYDTSVTVDNTTFVDNSTKSLNVSAVSFHTIRGVVEIAKLGPMCQCLCTNVTDVDVQIKSVPRLDNAADSALKAGESHFFEVRSVRQESSVNVSDVNLATRNGSQSGNTKDSNVTEGVTLTDSIVSRDVDVELLKLDTNVTDVSAADSTLNSTDEWSFLTSMEEREVDDSRFDEELLGDSENITSVILDFVSEKKSNSPQSNMSSLIVERESGQDADGSDNTSFDESDMDLEGLVLLKEENRNSTVSANSTLTADLEGSEE